MYPVYPEYGLVPVHTNAVSKVQHTPTDPTTHGSSDKIQETFPPSFDNFMKKYYPATHQEEQEATKALLQRLRNFDFETRDARKTIKDYEDKFKFEPFYGKFSDLAD